jgi:hypothetical protein
MTTTARLSCLVLACMAAALPLRAATNTPPVPAAKGPDSSPAEAAEIAALLQKYYDDPAALNGITPANAAALLGRLPGVALLPAAPESRAAAVRSELLPGRIGYWRAAGLSIKDTAALATELRDWNAGHLRGLVVDLRHCDPPATAEAFADAARIAGYFIPEGQLLFSIQGLQTPQKLYQTGPALPGLPLNPAPPLIVLVDRATAGAAEALAEALRRQAQAIVVGRSTAGTAALFTYQKLSSGRFLRIPTARVLLPDGNPLLGVPVAPDIAVFVDDRTENEALAQIALGPAARGLVEAPLRHRMNEASLVHEENPEIEEVLAEQYRQARRDDPAPLQDVTLMRAIDILKGIALFPAGSEAPAPADADTP